MTIPDVRIAGYRDLKPAVALLLLGSLAFTHLLSLPAFADEAGQVRWIFRIIEAGEWLQPLGDGKPFEAWPMVPLVKWGLPPLLAARALHVIAGMIGAVLTYRLALPLSDRGTAFVTGVLFAICPFVVYLERLALSDMFLCVASLWALVSIMHFIASPTWKQAILSAFALVMAALSKLPVGFVVCLSMPLALLVMPAPERRRLLQPPGWVKVLALHAPAMLLAGAIAIATILRMRRGQSPGFGLQDLVGIGIGRYPAIAAAIGVPRPTLIGELTAQLSWPVVAIGSVGIAAAAWSNDWRARWLIVVGALPMLAIGLLANFWFSRYLLFTLPPLLVAAVCGWRALARHAKTLMGAAALCALAICVGFMGYQSALIIRDPLSANWSPIDRFQYFEAAGSGFGFPEAAKFLIESPRAPRVVYALDGYSAYQLLTYLPASWKGRVRPIYYGSDGQVLRTEADRLKNLRSGPPSWIIAPEQLLPSDLVSSFGRLDPDELHLHKIAEFDKPGARTRLGLYVVAER